MNTGLTLSHTTRAIPLCKLAYAWRLYEKSSCRGGVLWASNLMPFCHVTLTWPQLMRPGLISDTKAACLAMTTAVLQ